MLILSQDREHVFNFNTICYTGLSSREGGNCAIRIVSGAGSHSTGNDIGIYSSKQRAMEVLEEMCNFFDGQDTDQFQSAKRVVYRMPPI